MRYFAVYKDFNDAVEMLEAIKKSTKNGKGAIAFKENCRYCNY